MSCSSLSYLFSIFSISFAAFPILAQPPAQAAPHIAYDSRTVLAGNSAAYSGAIRQIDMGPGKIGWIEHWSTPDDVVTWNTTVDRAAEYKVSAILESGGENCAIQVTIDEHSLSADCGTHGWIRVDVGAAHLISGRHVITVKSTGKTPISKLYSLEFVRPETEVRLAALAHRQSASTKWMVDARYGLMFHWTSQSQPQEGQAKPYCDAVRDFDVPRFVDMVSDSGAGFVIFTTSHARMYFPGPNPVIDSILPGRTCPRDLIGELADALGTRHIRLMLYFNPGHDDAAWWQRTHFNDPDKAAYFEEWRKVIAQIGRQYGRRLAGFWFDDAAFTYYLFNPSWQELAEAARTGNPDRVLTFNSWILPKLSDFYDVYGGENAGWDPQYQLHQYLPVGGNGRYTGGPQEGLQAEVLGLLNGDWGHFKVNQPVGPPRISTDELVAKMNDAIDRKEVPVLDPEIYQDGTISPETLQLLEDVRREIRGDSNESAR